LIKVAPIPTSRVMGKEAEGVGRLTVSLIKDSDTRPTALALPSLIKEGEVIDGQSDRQTHSEGERKTREVE
jgi:hypothetical protein